MAKFLTSDTHYGHKGALKGRPFSTVEEMDQTMIEKHNRSVTDEDEIFILGDFCFGNREYWDHILNQLRGKKYLIMGNHDSVIRSKLGFAMLKHHFVKITPYHEIKEKGFHSILCHYPMLVWNNMHHGSFMLHGHSHGNIEYPFRGKILDVGVDKFSYSPVSYDRIINILKDAESEYFDHHRPKE